MASTQKPKPMHKVTRIPKPKAETGFPPVKRPASGPARKATKPRNYGP